MPKDSNKTGKSGKQTGTRPGQKWCSAYHTTKHDDEECYNQRTTKPDSKKAFCITIDKSISKVEHKSAIDFTTSEDSAEGFMH